MPFSSPTYLNIYPRFLVQPLICRKSLLTPFLSRSMYVPPLQFLWHVLSFSLGPASGLIIPPTHPSCFLVLCTISFILCLAKKGWFIHSFLHTLGILFAIHAPKSLVMIEIWIFLSLSWVFCGSVIVFLPFCLEWVNWSLFFAVSLRKGCLVT